MKMIAIKIDHLKTETRNEKTRNLDLMFPLEIIEVMNEEDLSVVEAVKEVLPEIEHCILKVIEALKIGGRLIYTGAGTSGRLGILDAVECVPTFSTNDEVIGLIAGGDKAFVKAVEGAEDSYELAKLDLEDIKLNEKDVVIAITASGRTPYAIGALDFTKSIGAFAVSLSCNKDAELSKHSNIAIEVDAGPEILTGSTRLKAGTAQKMILNMISTVSMVGIGKVYGNLMVDMKPTNEKLVERAIGILIESTGCDREKAIDSLIKSNNEIKTAIVMILASVNPEEANMRLKHNDGFVRNCIINESR